MFMFLFQENSCRGFPQYRGRERPRGHGRGGIAGRGGNASCGDGDNDANNNGQQRCVHSGALYFVGEVFNCCMGVNVTIPALPPLPN